MTGPVALPVKARLLAWLAVVLALTVGAAVAHFHALLLQADERADAEATRTRLEAALEEVEQLEQRLAIADRGSQVTTSANESLRTEIAALQGEIAGLRADVEFYQRLLGSGGTSDGLAVHALQFEPTASPRVFRFQLTLSQNLKKARVVSGNVELTVEGVRGDQAVRLGASDLDLGTDGQPLRFEFKYFQQLAGSISLPEAFRPDRVRVRLRPEGRNRKSPTREFEWVELLSDGERETGVVVEQASAQVQ